VQVPGQDGEHVDDHHRPEREFEARAPMRQALEQRNLHRAPQPQHIFDAEHDHREGVEGVERCAVAGGDGLHRLGREGEPVADDQHDDEGVDDMAGGMRGESAVAIQPDAIAL
jgi:hypothetical protein